MDEFAVGSFFCDECKTEFSLGNHAKIEYHICINGQVKGPYSKGQLKSMWENGLITSDTQYWREGLNDWLYLKNFFGNNEKIYERHFQLEKKTDSYPDSPIETKKRSGCSSYLILATLISLLALFIYHQISYESHTSEFKEINSTTTSNLTPQQKACEAFIAQGENSKSINNAIIFYNKAIEADPKSFLAFFRRGYAYYQLQNDPTNENDAKLSAENAISNFNHAIEINPKSAETIYDRGLAYALKAFWNTKYTSPDHYSEYKVIEDFNQALNDYSRALQINPNLDGVKDAINKANKFLADATAEEKPFKQVISNSDDSISHIAPSKKPFNPNDPRSVADSYIDGLKKQGAVKEAKFLGIRNGAPQWPKGYYAIYSLDYVNQNGFRREGQYILIILPSKESGVLFVADSYPAQTPTGF